MLTNSSKGVNRHSALSTVLNALVSQALFKRKRPDSPMQRAANSRHPRVKLRVRSPTSTEAAPARPVKTASATALPALNMVRRLGIM